MNARICSGNLPSCERVRVSVSKIIGAVLENDSAFKGFTDPSGPTKRRRSISSKRLSPKPGLRTVLNPQHGKQTDASLPIKIISLKFINF